jgi:hypothetical protein
MPSAAAVVPKAAETVSKELFLNPNTIILAMDLDETAIAEAWVLKYFPAPPEENPDERPEILDRFLNMLDLRALRKQSVVIPLVRGRNKRGGRTNALGWYKAEGGERVTQPADTDVLVDEIAVCKPIHCEKYWEDSSSRYGGKLKTPEFCSALGEAVSGGIGSGATLKFLDVASRKNGELPSELVLRWA